MASKTPADLRIDLTELLLLVKEAHLAAAALELRAAEIENDIDLAWFRLPRYADAVDGSIRSAFYDIFRRDEPGNELHGGISETDALGFNFDEVARKVREAIDILDLALGAPEVLHV